ncbi:hypothetical protein NH286_02170 [Anaerococcus sp. NML200574]|uniref:hypothetical protein n=1 Tax=Anaerococcus sp. NML200574 TaxID=2954486 RepID=UPI002237A4A1|nr:hypothetical protein [Anaerococcus sp. NML200574]MCW6677959.1 hypothetical protein [Anaerococcus sp. NML200574]
MMNKIINKKIILEIIFYILSFPLIFLIFVLSAKLEFIPIFNNLLLILSELGFFSYQIIFIYKFTNIKINFYVKIFISLVLIGIMLLSVYFILIMSIFAFKDNEPFSYQGEKYYILNEGWLDDDYEIYRKKIITMDKLNFEESKKIFKDISNISNDQVKDKFEIYFDKDKQIIKGQKSLAYDRSGSELSEKEILKDFSLRDAKLIANSAYGLIEVDRAGARSRWFFIEVIDNKLNFISEIPDTSPEISGEISEDGLILLRCEDVNGNINFYKSDDLGKTFKLTD